MKKLSQEQERLLGLRSDTAVLAGAGAGKTTALAAAVTHALESGSSGQICLCTFTRAAAADVRARVEASLLDSDLAGNLWAGTIDSILYRFLRQEGPRHGWGLPSSPASSRELALAQEAVWQKSLLQLPAEHWRILEQHGLDPSGSMDRFLQLRDQARLHDSGMRSSFAAQPDSNELLDVLESLLMHPDLTNDKQREALLADIEMIHSGRVEGLREWKWGITRNSLQEHLQEAIEARNQYLEEYWNWKCEPLRETVLLLAETFFSGLDSEEGARDFWDLQESAQELVDITGPLFSMLFVDEAQDTNYPQYRLLRSMTDGPVVLIGDQNQSIYGFRGADPELFRQSVASGDSLELLDNYRSRPGIIRAVEALGSSLPYLRSNLLPMRSQRSEGEGPDAELLLLMGESRIPRVDREAAAAVPEILRRAEEGGYELSDIGCLVRSNQEVEAYAKAFRAHGAPALTVRRGGLLGQPECQDLLALLQAYVDRSNEAALLRVLASPMMSLSDQRLSEIFALRGEEPLWNVLQTEEKEFAHIMSAQPSGDMADIIRSLAESLHFDLLLSLRDRTGAGWRNCLLFFDLLRRVQAEVGPDPQSIVEAMLLESRGDEASSDHGLPHLQAVRVMTVHQAKGGEFPFLVVGRLSRPGPRNTRSFFLSQDGELGVSLGGGREDMWAKEAKEREAARELEEEERVLYVALTRARDKLLLVASGYNKKGGQGWGRPASLFPEELLQSGGGHERVGAATFHVQLLQEADLPASRPVQEGGSGDNLQPYSGRLSLAQTGALSYSKLAAWRHCGLRRYLQGELHLPASEDSEEEHGAGRRAFGIRFHESMARAPWPELPMAQSEEEKALLHWLAGSKVYEDILSGRDYRTEEPFVMLLGEREISGSIDLLYRFADEWRIIDWKTGKAKEEDDALQRSLYSLALLDDIPVRAQTILLAEGRVSESHYLPEDKNQLRSQVLGEIDRVLSMSPEPAARRRQSFCAGCPGTNILCPVSAHENEKEETKPE